MENGGVEAFVAVFDTNGNYVWSQASSSASDQKGRAVDFDSMGNVYLYGDYLTAVDWGQGEMLSSGSLDLFLAAFDPMGAPLWSQSYGNSSQQEATSMVVDNMDKINLIGSLEGSVDFGGYPAIGGSGSNDDVLFAKLNTADASLIWVRRFGDTSDQDPRGVAVDASGSPFIAGGFSGKLNFGAGSHSSVGGRDIFVAKLAP